MRRRLALRLTAVLAAAALVVAAAGAARAALTPDLEALYLLKLAAFGSEYGPDHGLARWEAPIRLSLEGSPTAEDRERAAAFLDQLNERVAGFPGIRLADGDADIRVTYAPADELGDHVADYVPDNWGYFSFLYEDHRITGAQIAIASDVTTQRQRNHLFMEELVGALGLAKDIEGYPDSIIYQPWTETQALSDLDWRMLNLLYHPSLTPGMSAAEADRILRPLLEGRP